MSNTDPELPRMKLEGYLEHNILTCRDTDQHKALVFDELSEDALRYEDDNVFFEDLSML